MHARWDWSRRFHHIVRLKLIDARSVTPEHKSKHADERYCQRGETVKRPVGHEKTIAPAPSPATRLSCSIIPDDGLTRRHRDENDGDLVVGQPGDAVFDQIFDLRNEVIHSGVGAMADENRS